MGIRKDSDNTEDSLLAGLIKNPDAILHWLTFYNLPETESALINQVNALITFGNCVNGWQHVAHGGMVATIMDEIMGRMVVWNKKAGRIPDMGGDTVTANLNITYLRPLTTPQTILVTAFFKEIKGRKMWIHARVEDCEGVVLAKAESLWVGLKRPEEKL